MRNLHILTSAAANYAPKVKVLFESLRQVRPEWRLHFALADSHDRAALAPTGCDVHGLEAIGIPDWRRWAFCHSLIELATAMKPLALKQILDRADCDAVLYLDPDILVCSDLSDVVAAFDAADILLTPHQTKPEPTLAGVIQNEICTLQHGVYNLGFIGVAARPEGKAFAEWWAKRVYAFCREDIPSGLYTDQRWVDLAHAYFDRIGVLRGAHLNLAPWNVSTRVVTRADDTIFVDGRPLGFVHFSAIDSGGCARFEVHPALRELTLAYRQSTAGGDEPAWGFACYADGEPISMEQRLVFRLRGDLQAAYSDPFASGRGTFQEWWRTQAPNDLPALFDPQSRAAEFTRLSSALTTAHADVQARQFPRRTSS